MDTETLFTATKWEILKLLEKRAHAPIELSKKLNSSLANVSQQLKLLELAGVIKSKRISNRDKGQPRVLYSLAGDLSYMIATTDDFVDKKVVQLSERNKSVLRIWFLESVDVKYALEKAFWQIEDALSGIKTMTYAGIEEGRPVIEVDSSNGLPDTIDVGNPFGSVIIRQQAEPSGYVLYNQR